MVVGLPGNMASLIAKGVVDSRDMALSLVGLSHKVDEDIRSGFTVELVPCKKHEKAIIENKPDIIVDFSRGSPERNCKLFCECGVPFVMGTTGGNMETMRKMVEKSKISAVIDPNMASPIVVIRNMLEHAARKFSGVFSGYSLEITESHQKMKTDTSGTAIAVGGSLGKMGAVLDEDGILSIRDPKIQKRLFGVPEEHLKGHGYHKYSLTSSDGTVVFDIEHNINGRKVYVDGTMRAIRFLVEKSDEPGKVFSMIDVLKG